MSSKSVDVSGIAKARPLTYAGAAFSYGGATFAVAAAYVAMHLARPMPIFPLDDPYITLHSAQVLHWGYDPNYIGVPALYGVTSAPFLALVYVLLFVIKPLFALDAACWLGTLLYILGIVRLARTFRMTKTEGLCFFVLGITVSYAPFNLLNGLETSWAMAGVVWTLALSSGEENQWKWAALAAGLTASIRPDLIPFAGLVVGALSIQDYQAHRQPGKAILKMAGYAALVSLAVLPWALWYYHATGVPYPLTGLAKRYFFASGNLGWRVKLPAEGKRLLVYLLTCGPIVAAVALAIRHPMAKAILIFFGAFLAGVYFELPDGLIWNYFRYTVVLAPMMLWAVGLPMTLPETKARRRAVVFLQISMGYALLLLPFCVRTYLQQCQVYGRDSHNLVSWSEQNLPSHARVMVCDAGYIAYASHFRIIDIVGLKTPEAVSLNRLYTWPSAGGERGKAVAALARDMGAGYLVMVRSWEQFALPDRMRERGWRVGLLRTEGEYSVFQLTPPNP